MEKLWTTAEVARFLGIRDVDVEQLVREGRLTGYKLGGQFLRFRPEQVEALKSSIGLRRTADVKVALARASWLHQTVDFLYFYDFYVISAGLLAILIIYLIAVS